MDKSILRKKALLERKALNKQIVEENSRIIVEKLRVDKWFKNAKTVGLYSAINNEVDVLDLLDGSKTFCLPKVIDNDLFFYEVKTPADLAIGRYSIMEPQTKQLVTTIDLLIVPLVAFDQHNNRLGYGKGYYDRFLKNFKGHTIGVAYQSQMVVDISIDENDIALEKIITEGR